jgi:hypothetical protein
VRVFGVDLPELPPAGSSRFTLVQLGPTGLVTRVEHGAGLPELATLVVKLAGGEAFVLGVRVPMTSSPGRVRAVDSLIRRRFGLRLASRGRAAVEGAARAPSGEQLLAAFAAAGQPCLPWPDRDRRQSGLATSHPTLCLKVLLWQASAWADEPDSGHSARLFRTCEPPDFRSPRLDWEQRAGALDIGLRALGVPAGFDLEPVRQALRRIADAEGVEHAASLLDAILLAGTARRYLDATETSVFIGDREDGYLILPADGFIRRLATTAGSPARDRLFPRTTLRERLGDRAQVRAADLLSVPGRPERLEATFDEPPRYEFDNLDEMLWWKHCRHLGGPELPAEGLRALLVTLDDSAAPGSGGVPLHLLRSRHRTLSFRFDPPAAWRVRIRTRDGRTYPFQVLRATFDAERDGD